MYMYIYIFREQNVRSIIPIACGCLMFVSAILGVKYYVYFFNFVQIFIVGQTVFYNFKIKTIYHSSFVYIPNILLSI